MVKRDKNQININDISGDVTVSNNQSGGITAHTVNVTAGLQKRTLASKIPYIIEELKKRPPVAYRLHYSSSDQEVGALVCEINKILSDSGWKKIEPIQIVAGPNLPVGITIFMLKPEEQILTFSDLLWDAFGQQGVEGQVKMDLQNIFTILGWPPVELPKGMSGVVIFVGPNPTN